MRRRKNSRRRKFSTNS